MIIYLFIYFVIGEVHKLEDCLDYAHKITITLQFAAEVKTKKAQKLFDWAKTTTAVIKIKQIVACLIV